MHPPGSGMRYITVHMTSRALLARKHKDAKVTVTSTRSQIRTIRSTRSSLRAEVEKRLTAAIVSGELAPGVVVSVPEMAARFAVSATPVREAMINLEQRGFVSSVRNKGFRIAGVKETDLEELVQIRRWLEVPATRLAAERFPLGDMQRFRALADDIVTAAADADFGAYLAADVVFHSALLDLTGNDRLCSLVEELRTHTRVIGLVGLKDTKQLERSAMEHHAMLDLIAEGELDALAALMDVHIGHVLGWWSGNAED